MAGATVDVSQESKAESWLGREGEGDSNEGRLRDADDRLVERRGKECCRLRRGLRAEGGHLSDDEERSEGEFMIGDEGRDTEVSRKGFE